MVLALVNMTVDTASAILQTTTVLKQITEAPEEMTRVSQVRSGPVFSYKLRYIVGFWLVEMTISTNQKPTIYRNLYENTGPD